MTANASATRLRVLIGDDEQDWSSFVEILDLGYSARDRSGIFFIEGQLTLIEPDGVATPESIDSRKNPARWKRGQLIKVDVDNGRGWERHPLGWVYILKEPLPPHPDNPKITIKLGCFLTLRDYKQPDDDKSGVTLGETTSRGTIIQNILQAAGIPFNETLNDYPLDVPLQKQDISSFVQQAGELAYSALYALYQTNQGTIKLVTIDTKARKVLFGVAIGGKYRANINAIDVEAVDFEADEITYEPLEGSETPADVVKGKGNKKSANQLQTTTTTIFREYAPSQVVGVAGEDIILIRQQVITETATRLIKTVRTVTSSLRGLISPVYFPGDKTFTTESITNEFWYYEGTESAKLIKYTKERKGFIASVAQTYLEGLNQPERDALKDDFGELEYVVRTYSYDLKELVSTVKTQKYEPIAAIIQDEIGGFSATGNPWSNPFERTLSETNEEFYTNLGDENYWKKKTINRQCVARAYPDLVYSNTTLTPENQNQAEEIFNLDRERRIKTKKALVVVNDESVTSNAGQANPPAAERSPQSVTEKEEPIEGVAEFQTAGTNEQPRERIIQVPYAVSQEQLTRIAQVEGALLIGKRLGQRVQIPFANVLTDHPEPWRQFFIIETDGTTLQYIADSIEYSHTPNSAIVGFDAIWIANLPAQSGNPAVYALDKLESPFVGVNVSGNQLAIIPPKNVTRRERTGVVHGFTSEVLPYAVNASITVSNRSGVVVGFRSTITINNPVELAEASAEALSVALIPSTVSISMGLAEASAEALQGDAIGGNATVGIELAEGAGQALDMTIPGSAVAASMGLAESTGEALGITLTPGTVTASMGLPEASGEGLTLTPVSATISMLTYTYSQSSIYSNPDTAGSYAKMTDDNGDTGAGTNFVGDQWIKADLGTNKTITKVQVAGGNIPNWGDVASFLNGADLQYSTDDINWTTIVNISGVTNSGVDQYKEFSFSPVTARYVRLFETFYLSTGEFKIYGY